MGGCCKSGSSYAESCSPLTKAPAPQSPAEPTDAYATAGSKAVSKSKRQSDGFLAWGEDPPGATADIQALEWLNFAVREIWPFADEAINKMIKEQVEPQMKEQLPAALKGLNFSSCHLGTNVPVLGPVHVHTSRKQSHPGVEIMLGLEWDCDADIKLQVLPGVNIGIKRLGISGTVCLVLRPLMKSMPIVGGLQIFMLSPPKIDWDFTGVGQFADFPFVSSALRKVVKDIISEQLVLPHRIFIHWVAGRENEIDITGMQFPQPEGLLRLCVVEARGLDGKDWNLFKKNTSDPYALIHVGVRSHQLSTKRRTCDPKWGDEGWFDFFIFSQFQLVSVELYDDDFIPGGDDFLGRVAELTIRDIVHKGDVWHTVTSSGKEGEEGRPAGEVRLSLQLFEFRPEVSLVKNPPPRRGKADTKALLHVQLRGMRGLASEKGAGAIMVVRVGEQRFESAPAIYMEAVQDFVYDLDTVAIDPAAQRMAEYLSTRDKLPVDQIAEIAGLHEKSLKKVLRERPSFTTRWNQGFNILLSDTSATVELELHMSSSLLGSSEPYAILVGPYQVKDLHKQKDMTWEGLLDMKHPSVAEPRLDTFGTALGMGETKIKEALGLTPKTPDTQDSKNATPTHSLGPLDVDIKFSLLGLQPI